MKTITIRYPIGIILCLFYCLVFIPFAIFNIQHILQMILGIPYLLFIPGYLFLLCLSPNSSIKSELDYVTKIALSIGLSIAIVSLNGILLFYTPFGFNLPSILSSITIINVLCGIIAISRWRKLRKQRQNIISFPLFTLPLNSKLDKILVTILICAITLTVTTAVFISFLPTKRESFTEFYILGSSGKTSNYPKNLTVGQPTSLTIGLINQEHKTIDYTIEIWLVNQTFSYNNTTQTFDPTYHESWFLDKLTIRLDHFTPDTDVIWQPQWEYLYNFNINKTGRYTLMFLLFTSPAPDFNKQQNYKDIAAAEIQSAYQSIHLWLHIKK